MKKIESDYMSCTEIIDDDHAITGKVIFPMRSQSIP